MSFDTILRTNPWTDIKAAARRFQTNRTDALRREALYRRTSRELSALSDRDLYDIGVARSSIHEIASRAALME